MDDEPTDPAICLCDECLDAARVKAVCDERQIRELTTIVIPRSGEVAVYLGIEGERGTRFGRGTTQLAAIEAALESPGGAT